MRVPPFVSIVVLILVSTAFYTMVGQLVPQKEVPAPVVIEIAKDVSTQEMVEIGKGIAQGKGTCLTCHTIGQSGSLRFPDLEGIGTRAATRIPGMSGIEYLAQSMYEPDVYVVEGFNPGMPVINKAPIQLTDDEILTVLAYLQSLGGNPSVTMESRHSYNGGEGGGSVDQVAAGMAPQPGAMDGKALFERYGCAECHDTTVAVPGEVALLASLHGIGDRMDRNAILASILDPDSVAGLSEADGVKKRKAMEEAGVYQTATLKEIQLIVDFLAEQKAKE